MASEVVEAWREELEKNLSAIEGLKLREIFTEGPRREFLAREVENHGTYRLFAVRPFGVKATRGLRKWRLQINVQPKGQENFYTVNDGLVRGCDDDLPDILRQAAEMLDEHIRANVETVKSARALAVAAVNLPDAAPGESSEAGDGV